MTKDAAVHKWVIEFNAFPTDMIETLMSVEPDDWREVTPPTIGDRVTVWNQNTYGTGEVISIDKDGEPFEYEIEYDGGETVIVNAESIELENEGSLPMWGTMWQFSDICDEVWLGNNLQTMSDCGFKIYESERWGYFFGIDGCGYSFYAEHWIPLYDARGLQWHDKEEEN